MKNLRKRKNSFFFSITEFSYISIILSAVFFGLFFFGLNHFYGSKMDYFSQSTVTITGKLRYSILSDKLMDLYSKEQNDHSLFYVDEIKKKNDNETRHIPSLNQFEVIKNTKGKNRPVDPNQDRIILTEVTEFIEEYNFKESYCKNFKFKSNQLLSPNVGGFQHILTIRYNQEFQVITHPVLDKNSKEKYKNKSKLCLKKIENLALEKINELYEETHVLALKKKVLQISNLKNQTHFDDLGTKKLIEGRVKKKVLNMLNEDLKELDLLIDVKNKTKLFKVESVKEKIDISFGRGNYINKYSIFFIISLLISIVFLITTKMLKKIFYKF